MQYYEEIKCLKCFSFSPSTMTYCRYCHQRFSHFSTTTFVETTEEKRINRKLVIAGAGLTALITGYVIFK